MPAAYLDQVTAIPAIGNADKVLLRKLLSTRVPNALAVSEDLGTLTVVDPTYGTLPLYVVQNGLIFSYDSTDSTTAADGTTCLVSADGKRYKTTTLAFPWSVISRTVATPPVSPSIGDAYLVAVSATGAWSGKDNKIAVFTASSWQYIIYPIGKPLYIQDQTGFYYRNAAGTWTAGLGSLLFQASTIPLSAAINWGYRVLVQNQTTTVPPGSPTLGSAYVVGPSATGAWAGKDGQIAICQDGSTWTYYNPPAGALVYDIAQQNDYRYTGSAWQSAAGSVIAFKIAASASESNISGTTNYSYDFTVAPTTSQFRTLDLGTITYGARSISNFLIFSYNALILNNDNSAGYTVALYRDSEVNAIAWMLAIMTGTAPRPFSFQFKVTPVDTLSHIYRIQVLHISGGSFASMVGKLFTLQEVVPS